MDSKVVGKELRRVVRPLLKDLGFTRFTGRTAWRFTEGATWVVNFQSFNAYLAEGVGCTTYSFCLNLGVHFDVVPSWAGREVSPTPHEAECAFRFTGLKTLSQPLFHPYGRTPAVDRHDVWFVRDDGTNLAEVVADARSIIEGPGLVTLQAYENPLYAYCALFDYRRHWPPAAPAPHIKVNASPAYQSPRWRDLVGVIGPLLDRHVESDLEMGLPDTLMLEVLGR
jgi:Domain of unknown function (DUF4304)